MPRAEKEYSRVLGGRGGKYLSRETITKESGETEEHLYTPETTPEWSAPPSSPPTPAPPPTEEPKWHQVGAAGTGTIQAPPPTITIPTKQDILPAVLQQAGLVYSWQQTPEAIAEAQKRWKASKGRGAEAHFVSTYEPAKVEATEEAYLRAEDRFRAAAYGAFGPDWSKTMERLSVEPPKELVVEPGVTLTQEEYAAWEEKFVEHYGMTPEALRVRWPSIGGPLKALHGAAEAHGLEVSRFESFQAISQKIAAWGEQQRTIMGDLDKLAKSVSMPDPGYELKKALFGEEHPITKIHETAFGKEIYPLRLVTEPVGTVIGVIATPFELLGMAPKPIKWYLEHPGYTVGTIVGSYLVGAGVGAAASAAVKRFGPAVTAIPKAGAAMAKAGRFVVHHPMALKATGFGVIGGVEAWKVKQMVEAGIPWTDIALGVGKDIASIAAFVKGFSRGFSDVSPQDQTREAKKFADLIRKLEPTKGTRDIRDPWRLVEGKMGGLQREMDDIVERIGTYYLKYKGPPSPISESKLKVLLQTKTLDPEGALRLQRAGYTISRADIRYPSGVRTVFRVEDLSKPEVLKFTESQNVAMRTNQAWVELAKKVGNRMDIRGVLWDYTRTMELTELLKSSSDIFKPFQVGKGGGLIVKPVFKEPPVTGATMGVPSGNQLTAVMQKADAGTKTLISEVTGQQTRQQFLLSTSLAETARQMTQTRIGQETKSLLASSLAGMAKQMTRTTQESKIVFELMSSPATKAKIGVEVGQALKSSAAVESALAGGIMPSVDTTITQAQTQLLKHAQRQKQMQRQMYPFIPPSRGFPASIAMPKVKKVKFKPFERRWPVGDIEKVMSRGMKIGVPKIEAPKVGVQTKVRVQRVKDVFNARELERAFKLPKTGRRR